jgi:SAM-dependent methyltransferase
MALKSNSEWVEWGRRDPLFGVASWANKNIGGSSPWTDSEFYALGEKDWCDFEDHWRRYGYTPGTFVEIGCGAGRITNQISKTFAKGHALDVSQDMIRFASAHVTASNVQWHVTQGLQIPLPDSTVDGVFSCHVFQHLQTPEAGFAYFAEIMRILKPGGTLMVHLPVYVFPGLTSKRFLWFCEFQYQRLRFFLDLRSSWQRLLMKYGGKPPMMGTSYEQGALYNTMLGIAFERVEISTFALRSNGALHQFVMATKPSRPMQSSPAGAA